MASKICSNCGESNSESAFLCIQCSGSLKDSEVVGTPNSLKTFKAIDRERICSHCNEKLGANDSKCKYCGTVYTKKTSGSSYLPSDGYASSGNFGCATVLLFIVTFFIPIVGLIVGGIFALNDDPEKQSIGKALLIFGLVMIVVSVVFYMIIL
ncbi:ribosomal protein L40E [Paenibacillus castaneae]|uniref:zinc ribbon domain-containing protein n=1 Tax=Paenibacillus castaneae TaxID=474957 RepID=UPI00141ACC29|nr:zinc ribbon domain-containing protein [Paenibacillus castaneae]NIK75300.1 ribosomal protein L40E [Paenibacillus castaneae]